MDDYRPVVAVYDPNLERTAAQGRANKHGETFVIDGFDPLWISERMNDVVMSNPVFAS